jgi:hypothetical protein
MWKSDVPFSEWGEWCNRFFLIFFLCAFLTERGLVMKLDKCALSLGKDSKF